VSFQDTVSVPIHVRDRVNVPLQSLDAASRERAVEQALAVELAIKAEDSSGLSHLAAGKCEG
jgi:hypothetical protein